MRRRNSRSSIRWRVATTVVALALCGLPWSALADGGGNGRLVAVRLAEPADNVGITDRNKGQPISDARTTMNQKIVRRLGEVDDHGPIGDDSDVASVEGSANDALDAGDQFPGGSF